MRVSVKTPTLRFLFQKSLWANGVYEYAELFRQYDDGIVTKVRAYEQNTKD